MGLTAVAISGGIDSLAAAFLLMREGHCVIGLHFITGYGQTDVQAIEAMPGGIGLPLHAIDLAEAFEEKVVRYFLNTYAEGQTPNPCLMCNPEIKFGPLLQAARELGADRLATGHYARVRRDSGGRCHLLKARDIAKDQSYFLARLSQEQLASACFPLAELSKDAVRDLARRHGLNPLHSRESQDICFVSESYSRFLSRRGCPLPEPGPIVDTDGKQIGRHPGLHHFTIGQRRGINCPAEKPYYVIRMDPSENRLVVGWRDALLSGSCQVRDINWIQPPPAEPFRVSVRVRYRHQGVAALCIPRGEGADLHFETPEPAVTPGQGAVFYQGDEVLGGGWITG